MMPASRRGLPRRVAAIAMSVAMAWSVSTAARAASPRPNIVFILADDLGWTDLACQGSTYYETPNIDRLAARGHAVHERLYLRPELPADPRGPPERAVRAEDRRLHRREHQPVRHQQSAPGPVPNVQQLALDKVTVAEALKKAGYATGMFGKWHLGKAAGISPDRQGFDEVLVSNGRHFDFDTNPPVELPSGHVPGRLPDRPCRRLHRGEQGPSVLPLPAALRRPRPPPGEGRT